MEARRELLEVMREARRLVALPGNNFIWSSWDGPEDALRELDEAIKNLERGDVPLSSLAIFFIATGPLQEVSLSSGWGDAFIALADRYDRAIASVAKPKKKKIVSLLPSATELVCWLGASDQLVGISHECDYPESIKDRPVLTRARIDHRGSSKEIDSAVRSVIENALSIYAVDEDRLAALAPDVIITQDLCAVCAVSLDDVRRAVAKLSANVKIVSLRPTRLEHVFGDLERVAEALDCAADGRVLRALFEGRIRAVAERAAQIEQRPRVVSIEWLEPIMLGGTWMPELIHLAGGTAVGAEAGSPAPTIDSATLAQLDPEVVVVKPCGFDLARTLKERDLIERTVRGAVPSARIYLTDGNAYFNRPGPRLVESLEIMAACVDPTRFADFALKHAAVISRC